MNVNLRLHRGITEDLVMLPPIALFYLVVAPALYGLVGALLKRGAQGIPPFAAMTVSMGVLFGLSFLCNLVLERNFSWDLRVHTGSIVALVLVGTVNTVALFCALRAYDYVPVWQYQLFSLLCPIFASLFAYLLLGEVLSPKLFGGLVLMAIGLYVAVR